MSTLASTNGAVRNRASDSACPARRQKPDNRRGGRRLPYCHSPQRFNASAGLYKSILSNCVPICDLVLAGVVLVRVACLFGVSHFPQCLRPAAAPWAANIDFLVHLHKNVTQVLLFRTLGALVDGLADSVPIFVHQRWSPSAGPHIRGIDERAQRTFFTFSKRQLAHPFPNGRVLVDLPVEPGP